MRRVELPLEMNQYRGKPPVTGLHFDQHPGLAITDNEEIHLAFQLIPQGAQVEVAETEVGPRAPSRATGLTLSPGAPCLRGWLRGNR